MAIKTILSALILKKNENLLRIFTHNTKAYFMQEAWHKIFTGFSLLPEDVGGDEM
ncbi:MAG: hypothetical protein ACTSYB_12795 [Candidatus Helarchaeota archaeon]